MKRNIYVRSRIVLLVQYIDIRLFAFPIFVEVTQQAVHARRAGFTRSCVDVVTKSHGNCTVHGAIKCMTTFKFVKTLTLKTSI